MKKICDLTQGNIVKQLLIVAAPLLFGQIFQNLYNSVDSIVVGKMVGTTALAAVTSCNDISHMIIGFFTGLSVGSSVLFSTYFGARDYENLHKAVHTALLLSGILGFIMATSGIVCAPTLLRMVSCPDDVFPEALLYLRIYLIGVIFTSIYNVACGVLRAVGNTQSPLHYLIVSAVINVVFDLITVGILGMGVVGVAIATIVAQLVSAILVLHNMMHTDEVYKLVIKHLRMDREILLRVIKLGLPAAIQTCLISFSNLFVQKYVNAFGASAMAGIGAAKKIDKYVSMTSETLAMALVTHIGQNIGAKKTQRAYKGIRSALMASAAGVILLGVPCYVFAPSLLAAFTNELGAIQYGVEMMRTMIPFYGLLMAHTVSSYAIRGFGYSHVALRNSIIGIVICRQLYLAIAMKINYHIQHVFISYPVGWFAANLLAWSFYFGVIKKKLEKSSS